MHGLSYVHTYIVHDLPGKLLKYNYDTMSTWLMDE